MPEASLHNPTDQRPDRTRPARVRLASLDAFRGLVIVVMFLVNVAGTDPAFPAWFPHRGWNEGRMGNGLADFVFPWFLFIVGCAIPFSMSGGRGAGRPAWLRILIAFKRGLIIYLLGTLMWCATIGYTRPITLDVFLHWDILPLIGFAYFLGVCVQHLPPAGRIAFLAAVIAWKWVLLTRLQAPDADPAVVEAALFWDRAANMQQHIHASLGWWGVMLTQGLPAAALVVLGAEAARILRGGREASQKFTMLAAGGLAMVAVSYLWHRFGGFPYSKDFFTTSYVLLAAGSGAAILAAMYWVIDVRGWAKLGFLRVYGMNALAVYVLAEFLWKTVLMRWQVETPAGGGSVAIVTLKAWLQHWTTPTVGSWLLVTIYILAYWAVSWRLDRSGIYIKV